MRSASRSRVTVAVLAVPTLLLGVAACGTTTAPTAQVAAHSAAQVSAHQPRWNEKTIVPAMRSAIEKQHSVHVALRASGEAARSLTARGDVAFGKGQPDLAFTADKTPFGGPAELRVVDGVTYVSMPPLTPKGKFLEIRPGNRSFHHGGTVGPMHGNPAEAFAALQAGLRKVTFVGQETVDGQSLQHYRLTVDPRAAARAAGMPHAGEMPHGYGPSHMGRVPRTVTFDVWLDSKALVHRVAFHKARHGSLVVDLTDWGKPVTVQAPPRKDVVERGSGQWPGMMMSGGSGW